MFIHADRTICPACIQIEPCRASTGSYQECTAPPMNKFACKLHGYIVYFNFNNVSRSQNSRNYIACNFLSIYSPMHVVQCIYDGHDNSQNIWHPLQCVLTLGRLYQVGNFIYLSDIYQMECRYQWEQGFILLQYVLHQLGLELITPSTCFLMSCSSLPSSFHFCSLSASFSTSFSYTKYSLCNL